MLNIFAINKLLNKPILKNSITKPNDPPHRHRHKPHQQTIPKRPRNHHPKCH